MSHIRPISGRSCFPWNLAEQIQHTAAFSACQAVQVREIIAAHPHPQMFQYRICCHSHTPFCERTAWPDLPACIPIYGDNVEKLGGRQKITAFQKAVIFYGCLYYGAADGVSSCVPSPCALCASSIIL